MTNFLDIPFACCRGGDHSHRCECSPKEMAVRRYADGDDIRPMTAEERDDLVGDANRCGEGYYDCKELEALSDRDLASATLNAWRKYVQSNCLLLLLTA